MSEANVPQNHDNPPNSETAPSQQFQARPPAVPGWQTVEFPNAISADASQRQALYTQGVQSGRSPRPQASLPNPQASAEGLIALIQDTNQRNHELMHRVAQLEEALEESRQALQAEIERASDLDEPLQGGTDGDAVRDLSAAQQQIHYLLNQLEFAQQTTQRQEILVETLTQQLQASQERVSQLEQERDRLQTQYEAQAALVRQCEIHCHDLQTRLQRQQRYTLQFKAALEKCLEVPPPSYETAAQVDRADSSGSAPAQPMGVVIDLPAAMPTGGSEQDGSAQADRIASTVAPVELDSNAEPPGASDATESKSEPLVSGQVASDALSAPTPSAERVAEVAHPFFPKVRQIRPWSAPPPSDQDQAGQEEAGVTPLFPQSPPIEPDGNRASSLSDLPLASNDAASENGEESAFSEDSPSTSEPTALPPSNFHATLLKLANTDLGTDLSEPPSESESPVLERTPPAHYPAMPPNLRDEEGTDPKPVVDSALENSADAGPSPTLNFPMNSSLEGALEANGDTLWRDLAKLVDASTSDILRAQQANDFAMFDDQSPAPPAAEEQTPDSETVQDGPDNHHQNESIHASSLESSEAAEEEQGTEEGAIAPKTIQPSTPPHSSPSNRIPPLSFATDSAETPNRTAAAIAKLADSVLSDPWADPNPIATASPTSEESNSVPPETSEPLTDQAQASIDSPMESRSDETDSKSESAPETMEHESAQSATDEAVPEEGPPTSGESVTLPSSDLSEEWGAQNPNWPSPLLYPPRSVKKRETETVDLPAFLR